MGCGGGSTQTSVQSNAPPQQFLDAYSQVYGAARDAASTPLNLYPGATIADFTPTQRQAFDQISGLAGGNNPWLTGARDMIGSATQPFGNVARVDSGTLGNLVPSALDMNQRSIHNYGQVQGLGSDVMGGLVPRSLDLNEQSLTNFNYVPQYSAGAVQQYMDPYLENVVQKSQEAFDRQNRIDDQRLIGNAIAKNAWGGDRAEIARAALAGEQRAAQDPVIANLYSQGFGQAQNQFNTQQAAHQQRAAQLSALQQSAANSGLGLYTGQQGLGLQKAAGQTAAEQAAAAQRLGLFGGQQQSDLAAAQAQGWLGLQGASALSGLGQQQMANTQALAGIGSLEQQQAQQLLNVPYQQWQALQSYPFQSIGWLSNIAQGLGSSSGNTSTSTQPGPNTASQLAGLGMGAAGVIGATGGFGSDGWLANAFGSSAATPSANYGDYFQDPGSFGDYFSARGGAIKERASGGAVPGFALGGVPDIPFGVAPVSSAVPVDAGVPNLDISIVPDGALMGGTPAIKRNYGTTQTSTGPEQDSFLGGLLQAAGTVAASIYGTPAAGLAVNELNKRVTFNRGGGIPGFAAGGMLDFSPLGSPVGVERTPIQGTPYHGLTPRMMVGGFGGMPGGLMDYARSVAAPIFSVPKPPVITTSVVTEEPKSEADPIYNLGVSSEGDSGNGGYAGGGGVGGTPSIFDEEPDDSTDSGSPFSIFSDPLASVENAMVPRSSGLAMPEVTPEPLYRPESDNGFGSALESEDRPSPWMSLAQAGFATAAGRSPNALTNLGQGATSGLNAYQKERQTEALIGDRHLRARVYQDTARERERANRSREGMSAAKLQMEIERAAQRAQNETAHLALAAERNAISRGTSGRPTEGTVLNSAVEDLVGKPNPKTEKPYTRAEAYRYVRGISERAENQEAADVRKANLQAALMKKWGDDKAFRIISDARKLKESNLRLTEEKAIEQAEAAFTKLGGSPTTPAPKQGAQPKSEAPPAGFPHAVKADDGNWYIPDRNAPKGWSKVRPGGG